ncbi:MAG: biopolymer transporter ExbD [Verrucomicrobiota bacterium]
MKLESTIKDRPGFLFTAPTVDIVLLLLIFFLFSSNIVLKSGVQLTLPASDSSLPAARTSHVISVVPGSTPQIYFNASRVDMIQLEAMLKDGRETSTEITLLGDRRVDFGTMMSISNLALRYGYAVAFGAQEEAR